MAASSHMKNIGDFLVDYDLDNTLGKGMYGKVFAGNHVRTGKQVAAKMFSWEKDLVSKETDSEAQTMMDIPDHDNVVKLLDYIKTEHVKKKNLIQIWLIMERCPLGNLKEFAEKTSLSTIEIVDVTLQSAYGIRHLHHLKPKGLTHRDIKLSNILMSGNKERPVVKIGDFGEAKLLDRIQDRTLSLHSVRGTFPFMAPELFSLSVHKKNPTYGKSVDVYSLGASSLAVLDSQGGSKVLAITGKIILQCVLPSAYIVLTLLIAIFKVNAELPKFKVELFQAWQVILNCNSISCCGLILPH